MLRSQRISVQVSEGTINQKGRKSVSSRSWEEPSRSRQIQGPRWGHDQLWKGHWKYLGLPWPGDLGKPALSLGSSPTRVRCSIFPPSDMESHLEKAGCSLSSERCFIYLKGFLLSSATLSISCQESSGRTFFPTMERKFLAQTRAPGLPCEDGEQLSPPGGMSWRPDVSGQEGLLTGNNSPHAPWSFCI